MNVWNGALVSELVHPYTGLTAIGVGKRGPIWPVMGAEDDDEGGDSDTDNDDGDDSDDSTDEGSNDTEKPKKAKKPAARVYTEEEYNKLRARMQAADRRARETDKQLKQLQDQDKPEDEKTKAQLAEVTKELEETRAKRKQDLIQLAFFKANDVEWHDPEDALTMADLSSVEIDDDGNVDSTALKAALKDLAKRKPHLVKKSTKDDDDDDEDDEEEDDQRSPSGKKMAGKRKGSKGKAPSRAELAQKFPALRSR
jgi:hypothetical protein